LGFHHRDQRSMAHCDADVEQTWACETRPLYSGALSFAKSCTFALTSSLAARLQCGGPAQPSK
jgi:hypothetical protein